MSNDSDRVVIAINNTHVAEVVKVTDGATQMQLVHRVKPKKQAIWLGIITYVLARKQGWDAHVCKHYFIKGGKLRYAWNLIAQWQGEDNKASVMAQIAKLVTEGFRSVPRVVHQLESYHLTGAKEGRNVPAGSLNLRAPGIQSGGLSQKGAHKIGGKRG